MKRSRDLQPDCGMQGGAQSFDGYPENSFEKFDQTSQDQHAEDYSPKRRAKMDTQTTFDPRTFTLLRQPQATVATPTQLAFQPPPTCVTCSACQSAADPHRMEVCSVCEAIVCPFCLVHRDSVICLNCITSHR